MPSNNSRVDDIIRSQSVIRIFFDEKEGFGDLVATMNVMAGVRATFGYTNVFQAIYPDEISLKLETLYNYESGLLSGSSNQTPYFDPQLNIQFMSLSHFRIHHEKIKTVPFGLSGAMLYSRHWRGHPNEELQDGGHNEFMDIFKVKYFIDVSPWVLPGNNYYPYVMTAKNISCLDTRSYFPTPINDLKQATELLAGGMGKKILDKRPALNTFMAGMAKQQFNVMPVYGWSVKMRYNQLYFKKTNDLTPANILSIIYAARYAQLHGTEQLQSKPLVIPVFYEYAEDIKLINDVIYHDDWSSKFYSDMKNLKSSTAPFHIKNATAELGLAKPGVFNFADISDVNAIATIKNLKPGTILLLAMPALPKNIFEGIFTHTATNILPAWREGPNLFYQLAVTGKPHFRCGNIDTLRPWEPGFDNLHDLELKTKLDTLYELYERVGPWHEKINKGLCTGIRTWEADHKIYQTLGELIMAAQNPQSAFSRYFQNLSVEVQNPGVSRLRVLVDKAINISAWMSAPLLSTDQHAELDVVPAAERGLLIEGWREEQINKPVMLPTLSAARLSNDTLSDPAMAMLATGITGTLLLSFCCVMVLRNSLASHPLSRASRGAVNYLYSFFDNPSVNEYKPLNNSESNLEAGIPKPDDELPKNN
jgi:hypothetical protein